ncbi:MAG: FtsX-like permease family protein, partial [Gimesia chilikensis]
GDQLVTLVFQRDRQQLQAASFEVISIFHSGTEMDQRLGLLPFGQLRNIPGQSVTPEGLRVQIRDVFSARSVGRELESGLPLGYRFNTWEQTHGNLYEAIQMSRYLVALIVMLILVIAAFNLVATLIIASADKQSEIAILKTLGAKPASLARVFAMQGMFIGTLGSVVGGALGTLLSLNLTGISLAVENFFGFKILSTEVYPLDYLPSSLHWGQLAFVVGVSIFLSVLASVYPAWKVSRIEPS